MDPKSLLIVGPSPESSAVGGIVTHMRTLRGLAALAGAGIFDPGRRSGSFYRNTISIFSALAQFRLKRIKGVEAVWFNATIDDWSILRVLLLSLLLPSTTAARSRCFFHGGRWSDLRWSNRPFFRKIIDLSFSRFGKLHFLSAIQLSEFVSAHPAVPAAIYRNFSSSDQSGMPRTRTGDPRRLLFVGRLCEEKGVREVIASYLQLRSSGLVVDLEIVGAGPLCAEIESIAGQANSQVQFQGALFGEALEEAYLRSDILVFPTRHPEGFPYVFIEAMRSGLPVVSTGEGALRDLVKDGRNGYLINSDPDSIVNCLEGLLKDPKKLEEMETCCFSFFDRFLSLRMAEEFYAELLGET